MQRITLKILIAFAIIPLFLLTNISDSLGYVWCVSNNGHSAIEQEHSTEDNQVSANTIISERLKLNTSLSTVDLNCGPCLDSALASPVHSSKNLLKNIQNDNANFVTICKTAYQSNNLFINRQTSPPLIRVAQNILIQRMVVLLI